MLFRKLLPLFAPAALLCSTAAQAQFGVYATVTGERANGFACTQTVTTAVGGCVPPATVTEKPYGANFGAYYDFRSFGPIRLGVDVRGGVLNTNKEASSGISSTDLVRHYNVLGGVRASTGTPIRWIRPYGEFAVGYAKFGPVYAYNNYTQAEGLIGVDVPLGSFIAIRAIEFGGGAMFGPSTHSIQSLGAGIVFHTSR